MAASCQQYQLNYSPLYSPPVILFQPDHADLIEAVKFAARREDIGFPGWHDAIQSLDGRAHKYIEEGSIKRLSEKICNLFGLKIREERPDCFGRLFSRAILPYAYAERMLRQFEILPNGDVRSKERNIILGVNYPNLLELLAYQAKISNEPASPTAINFPQKATIFIQNEPLNKERAYEASLFTDFEQIGQGSFGRVFRVTCIALDRLELYALKLPHSYSSLAGSIENMEKRRAQSFSYLELEESVLARYHRPFLVGPLVGKLQFLSDNGELLSGPLLPLYDGNLHDLIHNHLSSRERIKIITKLVDNYLKFKAEGFVHGDISLDNILFRIVDGNYELVFTDLVALNLPGAPIQPNLWDSMKGSYSKYSLYLRLEEAMDAGDLKAWHRIRQKRDGFAIAVCIYCILTGEFPFPMMGDPDNPDSDFTFANMQNGFPEDRLRANGISEASISMLKDLMGA